MVHPSTFITGFFKAENFLDPGLDGVALKIQQFWRIRVVTWTFTGVFLGLNIPLYMVLMLAIAVGCVEAIMWFAARPYRHGRGGAPRQRLAVMVGATGLVLLCDAVAILFWCGGTSGLRLMCAATVFTGLLHTQIFMSQSRSALIMGCVILTLTLMILMIFFGGYHGIELATISIFPLSTFGYVVAGGLAGRRTMNALERARKDADMANKAKSLFLATISHEIRTPLNGVLGMAQVLAMDDLTALQRERVGIVRQSGEMLLHLLNDVLDLSKIEAGKLELEMIRFDLGDLLRGTVSVFEDAARTNGLALLLSAAEVDGIYCGDPNRIRQIIANLISNAIKFTAEGEVRVVGAVTADGVELSISDTGIGIPADKIGGLFAKFSQVDASTTRRFGGTGLGLSISRELTELMGGAISAKSEEGRGSRFTVSLPLERLGDPEEALAESPQLDAGNQSDGLRILAAEDNPTNQIVLKTLLGCAGVDVTLVDNGADALTAWENGDWDLILMDVQMPVMDGPTATRIIREKELELGRPRTRIIALTANGMAHQIADYLASGMDGHLAKPIDANALFDVLNSVWAKTCAHPVDMEESSEDGFLALAAG